MKITFKKKAEPATLLSSINGKSLRKEVHCSKNKPREFDFLFTIFRLEMERQLIWNCINLSVFCSFRNWEIVYSDTVYYINLCTSVANSECKDWSVCSSSLEGNAGWNNLGSTNSRVFNVSQGDGEFSIGFAGGNCDRGAGSQTWETRILMKCGKFLVNFI